MAFSFSAWIDLRICRRGERSCLTGCKPVDRGETRIFYASAVHSSMALAPWRTAAASAASTERIGTTKVHFLTNLPSFSIRYQAFHHPESTLAAKPETL